jgi:hypothetical protein
MTNPITNTCCPHLGLDIDQTVMLDSATASHRCYALKAPVAPDFGRQEGFCLTANFAACPFYTVTPTAVTPPVGTLPQPSLSPTPPFMPKPQRPTTGRWLSLATLLSVMVTAGLGLLIMSANLLGFDQANTLPVQSANDAAVNLAASPAATASVAELAAVAVTPATPLQPVTATPTATATATAPPTNQRFNTPTPEPGGQVFLIGPSIGHGGWWKSNDSQRNHIDDAYLYAGTYEGETFIAAVRFDLKKVARGAPIREAQIRLTGLRQDQFQPDAAGLWLVQLVPESSLEQVNTADFLTMLSAPAAITLFPPLTAADLAPAQVNQWMLDETTRTWLEKQLLDGATSVILRIQASIERGEALFAWHSGLGSTNREEAPALLLSLGPPPPTPPPLPTRAVIVATMTPVPQNVLTVVAIGQTATAMAVTTGTYTPVPYAIVTPTPYPANLATVQTMALAQQLPPVILHTPVPNSAAQATRNADYATAVAITTGTFTPAPTNYVTPVLIPPSPPAQNVATEAARVVAATAVANSGAPTATPLPYNAVIALYLYATPTPANGETAVAEAIIATAAAKVDGTPTPLPWHALVITPIPPTAPPTTTPLPIIQSITDFTPTPTPLGPQVVPDTLPATLFNKILFKTNRNGDEEIYALDPISGELYRINEAWVYPLAQSQLSFSPDGQRQASVQEAADRTLQIHIVDAQYNSTRQLTALTGADIGKSAINYDPAWSPNGDRIAFVSTNSGNDEIYTVTIDGAAVQKLTENQFEWDKHPSWSPDGSQIVFFSNRETGRRQLWIMNADGSGQRNLSNNPYEDWDPIWVH